MANWMELPCDILEHLTSFLALPDYHRFSAVCKSWCYLAKKKQKRLAPQLPWLVLKENNVTKKRTFFSLSETHHYYMDIPDLCGQYVCGSSFGWLFTLDIHSNFRMINPFNQKSYDLPRLPPLENSDDLSPSKIQLELLHKVILDHDPNTTSDFTAMIVYGEKRQIAFWRLDFSAWRLLPREHNSEGHNWYSSISDIIFFKEKFYAVELPVIGSIYVIDVGPDPKVQLLKHPILAAHRSNYSYLVNFMGELMLVRRWREIIGKGHFSTKKFDVHRLDLVEGKSFCCDHINNYSFFIGNSSSIVIDSSQFLGCKKNSIYFTDGTNSANWANGRDDLGIYDLTQNILSRYYPPEIYHPMDAAPIWMNPNP